tara:strand:- start:320 stop:604 length:285 start_codon:yes stop_codon:yes gene_type:complete
MSQELLNKNVIERICKHMNADHKDALIKYAKHYAGIVTLKEVIMTTLTKTYLELEVDKKVVHINFDHTLENSEDAHKTLVSMLKSIPKGTESSA